MRRRYGSSCTVEHAHAIVVGIGHEDAARSLVHRNRAGAAARRGVVQRPAIAGIEDRHAGNVPVGHKAESGHAINRELVTTERAYNKAAIGHPPQLHCPINGPGSEHLPVW